MSNKHSLFHSYFERGRLIINLPKIYLLQYHPKCVLFKYNLIGQAFSDHDVDDDDHHLCYTRQL